MTSCVCGHEIQCKSLDYQKWSTDSIRSPLKILTTSSQTHKKQFWTSCGCTNDPRITRTILSGVNRAGGLTAWLPILLQSDSKKRNSWSWYRNRHVDQWSGGQKIHIFSHLILHPCFACVYGIGLCVCMLTCVGTHMCRCQAVRIAETLCDSLINTHTFFFFLPLRFAQPEKLFNRLL